jgi:hypothetical protein
MRAYGDRAGAAKRWREVAEQAVAFEPKLQEVFDAMFYGDVIGGRLFDQE